METRKEKRERLNSLAKRLDLTLAKDAQGYKVWSNTHSSLSMIGTISEIEFFLDGYAQARYQVAK